MNKIMVLATFHMQRKRDVINFKGTELINNYQDEIEELCKSLLNFHPTRIAVEFEKKKQVELDKNYLEYLNGSYKSLDEIAQIAFRLAKMAGISKLDAVDWMEKGAAERSCGEVVEYAINNQPKLWEEIEKFIPPMPDIQKETLLEAYKRENSKDAVKSISRHYMNYPLIGNESYFGNGWLVWWYQRNLNIFSNIAELAKGKDNERILLLIGASHKGILEDFIETSGIFEIENVNSYI